MNCKPAESTYKALEKLGVSRQNASAGKMKNIKPLNLRIQEVITEMLKKSDLSPEELKAAGEKLKPLAAPVAIFLATSGESAARTHYASFAEFQHRSAIRTLGTMP